MFYLFHVLKMFAATVDGLVGIFDRLGITGWVLFWLIIAMLYKKNFSGLISRLEDLIARLRKISWKDASALLEQDRRKSDRSQKQSSNSASMSISDSNADTTAKVGVVVPEQATKQAITSCSGLSAYESYWLGHDLAWTQMVLLTMGSAADINYGLRQSLSHLSAVLTTKHAVYANLESILASCASYTDTDWTEAVRVSVFNQLGVLKNELGAEISQRQARPHD